MESGRSGRVTSSSSKSEERNLPTSKIFPLQSWLDYLREEGEEYRDSILLGEGYDFRMPTDIDCTTIGLIDEEFVVYASTLKLGLRFPPHPFVIGCWTAII